MVKLIIFDTNFFVSIINLKINFLSELKSLFQDFKIIILPEVLKELQLLSEKKVLSKEKFKLCLSLIEKLNFSLVNINDLENLNQLKLEEILNTKFDCYFDDIVVRELKNYSKSFKENIFIATNDVALKKRLYEIDVKIIYVKQKKYLRLS